MDAPNPASGEEYFHTNTQRFNTLHESNRFKIGEAVSPPWNAPEPGAVSTMDGSVTDYISMFTAEIGRQPTYEEYAQIMTGSGSAHPLLLATLGHELARRAGWRSLTAWTPAATGRC